MPGMRIYDDNLLLWKMIACDCTLGEMSLVCGWYVRVTIGVHCRACCRS